MATSKKRINISVSDAVEEAVATLAKRDRVPQATKAAELLHWLWKLKRTPIFLS